MIARRKAGKRPKKKKRIARKKISRRRVGKKPAAKRRPVKKKTKARSATKQPKANIIGLVTHYFPQVRAAVVKLKAPLSLGDSIRIKGHTTDFAQLVNSLQIDRQPITKAKKGQEIGLLVNSRVRRKDVLFKA